MWPRALWARVYEPLIRARRRARPRAGRSPIPTATRNATRIATCWWSAPARPGSPPRCAAAAAGARVILCDEQAEFGGSLLAETDAQHRRPARCRVAARRAGDAASPHRRSRCCRAPPPSAITPTISSAWPSASPTTSPTPIRAAARAAVAGARAKEVVLATGAIERPLVFPGNDRPGIMLADAARTYATRYGVRAGTRAVVVDAVRQRLPRGARPAAGRRRASPPIADLRAATRPLVEARAAGIRVATGAARRSAPAGRLRVRASRVDRCERASGIACDLLLMCRRLDADGASVLAVARQARA